MADREVLSSDKEVPEIPELLEQVFSFCLGEAQERLEKGEPLIPFTALVVKETLFLESHPGDNPQQCFAAAEATVKGARGAGAYAFCYDGYVDTDEGTKDAILVEGGIPGSPEGYAVSRMYELTDEGACKFEEGAVFVGMAPNFMAGLKEAAEYSDEEIDDKYLDEEELPSEEEVVETMQEAVMAVTAPDSKIEIDRVEDGGLGDALSGWKW